MSRCKSAFGILLIVSLIVTSCTPTAEPTPTATPAPEVPTIEHSAEELPDYQLLVDGELEEEEEYPLLIPSEESEVPLLVDLPVSVYDTLMQTSFTQGVIPEDDSGISSELLASIERTVPILQELVESEGWDSPHLQTLAQGVNTFLETGNITEELWNLGFELGIWDSFDLSMLGWDEEWLDQSWLEEYREWQSSLSAPEGKVPGLAKKLSKTTADLGFPRADRARTLVLLPAVPKSITMRTGASALAGSDVTVHVSVVYWSTGKNFGTPANTLPVPVATITPLKGKLDAKGDFTVNLTPSGLAWGQITLSYTIVTPAMNFRGKFGRHKFRTWPKKFNVIPFGAIQYEEDCESAIKSLYYAMVAAVNIASGTGVTLAFGVMLGIVFAPATAGASAILAIECLALGIEGMAVNAVSNARLKRAYESAMNSCEKQYPEKLQPGDPTDGTQAERD